MDEVSKPKSGRPRTSKKHRVQMALYVEAWEKKALEEHAKKTRRSLSQAVMALCFEQGNIKS